MPATGGNHQKSPIISDAANDEWETASETSDHGAQSRQQNGGIKAVGEGSHEKPARRGKVNSRPKTLGPRRIGKTGMDGRRNVTAPKGKEMSAKQEGTSHAAS